MKSHGEAEREYFKSDEEWITYLRTYNHILNSLECDVESAGNRLSGMGYHDLCNDAWKLAAKLKAMRVQNNEEICELQRNAKAERMTQKERERQARYDANRHRPE